MCLVEPGQRCDPADVEQRGALHRGTSRDRVKARTIRRRWFAGTFRDVEGDGDGCPLELVANLPFAARKPGGDAEVKY